MQQNRRNVYQNLRALHVFFSAWMIRKMMYYHLRRMHGEESGGIPAWGVGQGRDLTLDKTDE